MDWVEQRGELLENVFGRGLHLGCGQSLHRVWSDQFSEYWVDALEGLVWRCCICCHRALSRQTVVMRTRRRARLPSRDLPSLAFASRPT